MNDPIWDVPHLGESAILAGIATFHSYGWDGVDRALRLKVGWISFGSDWLSLAVINGILTFMRTPGDWVRTRSFWDGLLSPTCLPSLCLRKAMAGVLTSLYALVGAALAWEADPRAKMVHYAGFRIG